MTRGRRVLLLASSTALSVALAVAVNVATGGSLPGPLEGLQWAAWPLVGVLAAGVVVLGLSELGPGDALEGRAVSRPAELPPDVAVFAGHAPELAALLDAVPERPAARLGSPVVIGIFGPGGIGKTVLATHLAHAVAGRYPDGQLFVALRGASPEPVDPGEVLRRLLHALGVAPVDVPEDPDARQALYRTVLADRRVLIHLDDAGSEGQVRPLIPAGRGCLVLVTARPSLVGIGLTARQDLDVLPEAAALALLATISGAGARLAAEPEAAAAVARHCGYLPLALAVAAARLRNRPRWAVEDLARRLADERRRLDELQAGNLDVRASIGLGYAGLDPTVARLFRRLSLLGYADFGPGVAAALLGGADQWPASEMALEQLADAKLIDLAGPRRYRFHDLVRLFARERLESEESPGDRRAALLRSLDYYRDRAREQWQAMTDPAAPGERRRYAEAWFERSRVAIVAAVQRAEEAAEGRRAWELAAAVAPYLAHRGYPVDLTRVSEVAVRAARRAGDEAALATALFDLGQAHRHRSRHEPALAAFAESLALHERLGHRAAAASVLHGIGDTEREAGRASEAESAYTRAIGRFEELGRSRDAAVVQSALAALRLMQGRIDEATELLEVTVDRLGIDGQAAATDSGRAWALETLGALRQATGRHADAEQLHRRSLASFRARGERHGAAWALLNLGRCAAALGRPGEVRRRFAESLRLFTEIGDRRGQAEVRREQERLDASSPAGRGRRGGPRRERQASP